MSARSLLLLTVWLSACLFAAVGCGSDGPRSIFTDGGRGPVTETDNGFESDDPYGRGDNVGGGSSSSDNDVESTGSSGSGGGAGEPERIVQEADLIKVDGDRLYALSKIGGLAIIDIANPDRMKLLGRKRIDGVPFEMYVKTGRAFVMLNQVSHYWHGEGAPYGHWVQTGEILAFDVTDPGAIAEVSRVDVPGAIADSRLVGSVAYVVTYENGYCWGCQSKRATVVTSFYLDTTITKRDQLVYSSTNDNYVFWQRSVSATNQRLYIAGPEWNMTPDSTTGSSIIQVVDISDPTGKLVKGADIPVAGQIHSRWQMDEHEGVLRVVSQLGWRGWNVPSGQINPKIQTFAVTSSTEITPLGSAELVLPAPEHLQSVRFDGTRAYAITAQQTDPLFTIDLSDPAEPKQMGALEMSGGIFHLEPLGDRLVGFGYDGIDRTRASLAVSLFDVSDLSEPKMLKRVSFGTGWGQLAEDQDRIQKAVGILDDQGMILVPFASQGLVTDTECVPPQSGIQIIDHGRDDLTLRGIAPHWGPPRRAFVANGRLLSISERNVTSFDIASRDAPVKTGELDLSNPAYRLAELPGHVASITTDWWTGGEVMLSITPKGAGHDAMPIGKVSLAPLTPPNRKDCSGARWWTSWFEARLFVNGDKVYVVTPAYWSRYSVWGGKLIAAAIDVSNPAKPSIVGRAETPFAERDASKGWEGAFGFWDGVSFWFGNGGGTGALVGAGQAVVQLGAKLAYLEVDRERLDPTPRDDPRWRAHRRLHVVDFGAPAQPKTFVVDLPDSYGAMPLHVSDGRVLTSRWVQSTKNPDKVRFFVDRIDLRGATPTVVSINTPGSLLLADEPSSRFVTTDYHATRLPVPAGTPDDHRYCREKLGWRASIDRETRQCILVTRDFKLSDVADTNVTLRHTLTPPSQNFGGVEIADDRVYLTRFGEGLWAIGGVRAGELAIVSEMEGWAGWPLAAHGTKVALPTSRGFTIWDTATSTASLVAEVELRGRHERLHVLMNDEHAIASQGEWGFRTIRY